MESEEMSAHDIAAKAAKGFKVKECGACAESIKTALSAAGHKGKLVEIRGLGGGDFMICLSFGGGQATITQNGKHMGIQFAGTVFDNLHPEGMAFEMWLQDFDAIGGVEIFSVTDF